VPRHNNLRLEQIDTPHCGFEIVDLEPEQHPIAIWLVILIPDRTVVMIDIKAMQLEDQNTSRFQSFVLVPTVIALAAKQSLIPAAAGFDISDGNQGLRTHKLPEVAGFGTLL
jgi:hypothetical protein